MIEVLDGGVSTTVQDAGRFGLFHLGMPPSGALDDYSFRAANLLVGNDEQAAVLEATLNGPTLAFGEDAVIAVTGGIDVPVRFGSRSTYALCGIGGHEGRPLRTGDSLPVGPGGGAFAARSVPERLRPRFAKESELRVIMGLCNYRLTAEGRRSFLETEWTITPAADRIGYRYRGATLEFELRAQPFGAGSEPSN